MYIVTVEFTVHPDSIDQFKALMIAQAENSLEAEEECLHFDVCWNPLSPTIFFLYEQYTSEASFKHHLTTPHFLAFDALVKPLVQSKLVNNFGLL